MIETSRKAFSPSIAPARKACPLGLVTASVLAVAITSSPAQAADPVVLGMRTAQLDDPITPQSAADARMPVQSEAKTLHDGGDDVAAANMLMARATELKDPVLFLDAADAFLAVAIAEKDLQWLDGAEQMARIADDMLRHLDEVGGSDAWSPVAPEHVSMVLERGTRTLESIETAREEILASQNEDETPAELPPPPAPKNGKGLFVAGAVLTGFGVVGLGATATGMVLGAQAQRDVTDPLVYRPEHEDAERIGPVANVIAYAGGGLAVVGLGAGIALMVVGKKRQKAAQTSGPEGDPSIEGGADTPEADDPTVAIIPGFRGLTIRGTF